MCERRSGNPKNIVGPNPTESARCLPDANRKIFLDLSGRVIIFEAASAHPKNISRPKWCRSFVSINATAPVPPVGELLGEH
jgi:hypothetical protein